VILRDEQQELCDSLGLKGRILISEEGINGTVGGSQEATDQYIQHTSQLPGLEAMEWKTSQTETTPFFKMHVRVRHEVVTLGLKAEAKDVDLNNKADYIEPDELKQLYDNEEEFIIVDTRNEYESLIGKFEQAIVPEIENFRDFPDYVQENLLHLKDKPIVTYCTGGIRCEKASAYLKEQGFTNVRQLHGGIHRYGDLVDGKHFQGEMYVFDYRIHVPVNTVNPTVISQCIYCETLVSRYLNCTNKHCHDRIICCEACEAEHEGLCIECHEAGLTNHSP
ncbi:MAG: rhodanese-related sulfurtransferase, partial [Chloroflexota bacterium]